MIMARLVTTAPAHTRGWGTGLVEATMKQSRTVWWQEPGLREMFEHLSSVAALLFEIHAHDDWNRALHQLISSIGESLTST